MSDILESAITAFRAAKDLADRAVSQLADDQLHQPLDANTNSIVVIMKHTTGNLLSRWTDFLASDGEKPWRNRDDEFVDSFTSRTELLDHWEKGWSCLFTTLDTLTADDLAKTVTIRGERHTVAEAIHRSLAHCSYHVGQIVLVARVLAKDDWQTLTIPKGQSDAYNQETWGSSSYTDPERE